MKKRFVIWVAAAALLTLIPAGIVGQKVKMAPQRVTPAEIPWSQATTFQQGSGMQPGLKTVFVTGDGKENELYSLVFKVPANTSIQPHTHPDERSCFVLSGLWYFGYGTVREETKLKALPPGSNYTEPANTAHFAGTKEQEAIVECTAVGPTGTTFVKPAEQRN